MDDSGECKVCGLSIESEECAERRVCREKCVQREECAESRVCREWSLLRVCEEGRGLAGGC